MKKLLVSLLVLAAVSCTLPADAKFHPVKFLRRAVCVGAGVALFPVLAPTQYVIMTGAYTAYATKGDVRMASYMIDGREYDWLWIENWGR